MMFKVRVHSGGLVRNSLSANIGMLSSELTGEVVTTHSVQVYERLSKQMCVSHLISLSVSPVMVSALS